MRHCRRWRTRPDDREECKLVDALWQLLDEALGQLVHAVDGDELRPESREDIEGGGDEAILDGWNMLLCALASKLCHLWHESREELF